MNTLDDQQAVRWGKGQGTMLAGIIGSSIWMSSIRKMFEQRLLDRLARLRANTAKPETIEIDLVTAAIYDISNARDQSMIACHFTPNTGKRLTEKLFITSSNMNLEMRKEYDADPANILKFYQNEALVCTFKSYPSPPGFMAIINATLPDTAIASLKGRPFGSLVELPKEYALLGQQKITNVASGAGELILMVRTRTKQIPAASKLERRLIRRHFNSNLMREFLRNMPGAPITLITLLLSASFMAFATFSTDIGGLLMRMAAGVALGGSLGIVFFMVLALREQIRAMRSAITIVYPGGRA